MKLIIPCLALFVATTLSNEADGQLFNNLFGNSGSTQAPSQGFQMPKLQMPQLFNTQNKQSDVLGAGDISSLTKWMDNSDGLGGGQTPGGKASNMLDQFNMKSKQAIDRTTNWARDKQQRLKESTLGRLKGNGGPMGFLGGFLSGNQAQTGQAKQTESVQPNNSVQPNDLVEKPSTKPNYYAPKKTGQAAQPPVRTAANAGSGSTTRF